MIAATAGEMNVLLVTGDGKHYPMEDIQKDTVFLEGPNEEGAPPPVL
jgi:hypothetical protein